MMNFADIQRLTKPIKDLIFSICSIGSVDIVDDTSSPQSLQVELLAGEIQDDVEHYQPFGLTANLPNNTRGVFLSVGGKRSQGVFICADGGNARIKNLQAGEVAIYNAHGRKIVLTQENIDVTGNVIVAGDVADSAGTLNELRQEVAALRNYIATHIHSGGLINGNTGAPLQPPPQPQ